jgi:hypothetical protein
MNISETHELSLLVDRDRHWGQICLAITPKYLSQGLDPNSAPFLRDTGQCTGLGDGGKSIILTLSAALKRAIASLTIDKRWRLHHVSLLIGRNRLAPGFHKTAT